MSIIPLPYKIGLLAAILAAAFFWGWRIKDRLAEVDKLEAANKAQAEQIDGLNDSAEAAQAARTRNDEVIPAVRNRVQARVSLPDTASDAERLRDDEQAVAEYSAAASRLRGTGAR